MAYTIGQLAKLTNLTRVTIRYYEKIGLLDKVNRSKNGYRCYLDSTLERLYFIKNAQLIGFSLSEIKELVMLKASEMLSAQDIKIILHKKIDLIDLKIKSLRKIKRELNQLDTLCSGKMARKECPILKVLSSNINSSQLL